MPSYGFRKVYTLVPNSIPMIICYAVEPIKRNNYKGIYNKGCRNPMLQPHHLQIVPFIIIIIIIINIIIIIIIIIITITVSKGYFIVLIQY